MNSRGGGGGERVNPWRKAETGETERDEGESETPAALQEGVTLDAEEEERRET